MTIMIWKCVMCGEVRASTSLQRHQMDSCRCGSSSVDIETYGCRYLGNATVIKVIETGIIKDMCQCSVEQDLLFNISWDEIVEEERESYERQYK